MPARFFTVMRKIEVVRERGMADGVHPKTIPCGEYVVEGTMSYPDKGKVSVECARIFLEEGWAREVTEPGKKDDDGRRSPDFGPDKPSVVSPAAPASHKKTSKKSKAKPG